MSRLRNQKSKFIIFGQGRSGSNLLVDLLNSHPDIYCEREILNNLRVNRNRRLLRFLINNFPYIYINYFLYRFSSQIFGFKLIVRQLKQYEQLKTRLFNGSWKIIHIQRNDILQQTFSSIIANKTGKFKRRIGNKEDLRVFNIKPQTVVNNLIRRTDDLEYEKKILNGVNYINIVYEKDLANSTKWTESMRQVFEYLDLKPVDVTTAIIKTNQRSVEHRISNYKEIIEYLKNTQFSNLVSNTQNENIKIH